MNNRCLYCFRELTEGQVDFHEECAIQFFGSPTPHLSDDFVVKQADAECSYRPEVEVVAMRMAQSVMILTDSSSLVRLPSGSVAFARRFNQHVETLPALVERLEGCEFDGSAEMIAELVEDFSSIAKLDVVNFFEQLIFGWVVGCDTMSLWSFALSRPNAGVCSLAAAFDFDAQIVQSGDSPFGLTVNDRNRKIGRRDFEAAMRHMGLKDRIIRITIEKMIKAKEQWFEIVDNSLMDQDCREALKHIINRRVAILEWGSATN